MSTPSSVPLTEAWLRGPIPGIPALLQPAAHAFVLAREDVDAAVAGLTAEQLWRRPGGVAPIGFHIAHLAGATSRLMTYATGQPLSDAQKAFMAKEKAVTDTQPPVAELIRDWHAAIDAAMAQLAATPEATLADARAIGRAQLPTTVIGAIFPAAEHAARHAGQVVTTAKVVR